MTDYEILSIAIASLAALLSAFVWNGQRKLQRRSNELQEATAELARKQLEMIQKGELQAGRAGVSLYLSGSAKGYYLEIWNHGPADARNIRLRPAVEESTQSLLVPAEVATKLPIMRLKAGEVVRLIAAATLDTKPVHDYVLEWENQSGSQEMEICTVRL
jgi:hypothetical protein